MSIQRKIKKNSVLWIVHKNEIEGDYELPQIDGSFRHLTYVVAVAGLAQASEYYR